MSEEARDLNADLAAAWEAMEESNDQSSDTESGGEVQGGDAGYEASESEETAAFGEGADSELRKGDSTGQPDADKGAVQGDGERADGEGRGAASGEKPPVGLSPEAREVWKDTPEAMRKEIAKREKDFAYQIQKTAEGAKRAESMDRALAPYQQLFEMNGGAGQMLPSLLQTASLLQMGSPQQKAQMAANIIQQFGVDIRTLDSLLVGDAPPPEVQQQSQIEQLLNQRLAPLQQQLQQYQQRDQYAQQEAQGRISNELQQFASQNEFYEDVKNDMADLMELAANRGREMSLEQAYKIACNQHPTISKIMDGRASTEAVHRKRNAASSVAGSPAGVSESRPGSIAEALNQAWDSAGRI